MACRGCHSEVMACFITGLMTDEHLLLIILHQYGGSQETQMMVLPTLAEQACCHIPALIACTCDSRHSGEVDTTYSCSGSTTDTKQKHSASG